MDHRRPFSRQPAQPHSIAEDPRYPPIPPPPYSSQRQDLPPHNDPFFPRRQPYDNHAASPTKADQPPSYGVPPPPYPPNPFAATHNHNVNDGRARRGSYDSNTIYDHLRREENESRNGESRCIFPHIWCYIFYALIAMWYHCLLRFLLAVIFAVMYGQGESRCLGDGKAFSSPWSFRVRCKSDFRA